MKKRGTKLKVKFKDVDFMKMSLLRFWHIRKVRFNLFNVGQLTISYEGSYVDLNTVQS